MAIFELRIYSLKPGAVPAYLKLYHEEAMAIHVRHLGPAIGWWVSDIGPLNQIVMLWRYDSHADRDARRAGLMADREWLDFLPKTGSFIVNMENRILKATAFSPMQ